MKALQRSRRSPKRSWPLRKFSSINRGDSARLALQTEQVVWMGGILAGLMVSVAFWMARSAEQSRCEAEAALQEANAALEKRASARASGTARSDHQADGQRTKFQTACRRRSPNHWTAKTDGTPDYYNQRWSDYAGRPSEQGKDISWETVLHPEMSPFAPTCWARAALADPYSL